MVRLTLIRLCSSKSNLLPTYLSENQRITFQKPKNFIDSIKIFVEGGNGGNGFPAFGGKGGNGGNVIFKCNPQLDSLRKLRDNLERIKSKFKRFKSKNGEDSFKYKLVGANGEHFVIHIPPGCTLKNQDGGYIGEVDCEHDQIILPIGGEGGCKENNYIGRLGVKMPVIIDLKLISDIGLVGYPNAGKSTLLKALTRAKPDIANVPFTTLAPNIGIIKYPDLRQISVADLPGLVKNAHLDIGLGHKFLKHVVRTKIIMFVIAAEQLITDQRKDGYKPIEILLTLLKEIELYDDSILNKPSILLMSKCDKPNAEEIYNRFLDDLERIKKLDFSTINLSADYLPKKLMDFDFIMPISSKTSWNIKDLQKRIRELIDHHFEAELIKSGQIDMPEQKKLKKKDHNLVVL